MPTRLAFHLTDHELALLEKASSQSPYVEVRQRATTLRLLHFGCTTAIVAQTFALPIATIENWQERWSTEGLLVLADPNPVWTPLQSERPFLERLKALHEVSIGLVKTTSFDDLCRQAVELGRSCLGYDRLGLFFLSDKPNHIIGSFGTDENGQTRDERSPEPLFWEVSSEFTQAMEEHRPFVIWDNHNVRNRSTESVGFGWQVIAFLWDGEQVVGCISADNLLSQRPLTEADIEILKLYGLTLGNLCTLKRAEDALVQEHDRLQTIIDSTQDYIYITDRDSRIVMMNHKADEDFRRYAGKQSIIGAKFYDFYPDPTVAEIAQQQDLEIFTTGVPVLNREVEYIDGDDTSTFYLTSKVPLRDSQGNILWLAAITRDITDIKTIEQERLELVHSEARIKAEFLLHEIELRDQHISDLDAFAQQVAHDLKNPLNIVQNLAYLLQDDIRDLKLGDLELLNIIASETRRMGIIVNTMLEVARLKREEVETQPVDVEAVVRSTLQRLNPLAVQYGAEIIVETPLPLALGISNWLEEVWFNYISNALKYGGTPPKISIGANEETTHIRYWVRDNGNGISPQNKERLFSDFSRIGESSVEGHGIGLTVVKTIVEKLAGTVGVESEGIAGAGTTFSFTMRKFIPSS